MSGFITIERNTWDHPLFAKSEMSETEAWMWMIARASWSDTKHRVGSEMVDVPRGSFMATLRELQAAFMWGSDKRVRTFLKMLEKEAMIGRTVMGAKNAPKTHVTICNYDEFQSRGRTKDAPKTQERTHHGRTTDAVKEQGNKVTREDTGVSSLPAASKNGSRLSQDWFLPVLWGEWAMDNGAWDELVRNEADKFKDYWIGVAGARARKADWEATWRNWIRKAILENKPNFTAINGGRNDRPHQNPNAAYRPGAGSQAGQRPDPALERIARLAGVVQAPGDGRL